MPARALASSSFGTEIENASSGLTLFSPPTREWMLIHAADGHARRNLDAAGDQKLPGRQGDDAAALGRGGDGLLEGGGSIGEAGGPRPYYADGRSLGRLSPAPAGEEGAAFVVNWRTAAQVVFTRSAAAR